MYKQFYGCLLDSILATALFFSLFVIPFFNMLSVAFSLCCFAASLLIFLFTICCYYMFAIYEIVVTHNNHLSVAGLELISVKFDLNNSVNQIC